MRKSIKIVFGTAVAVVVVAVAAVAVYVLTRDEAPEAVDLETTVDRIEAAEASTVEPQADAAAADIGDVETGTSTHDDTAATGTDDTTDTGPDATTVEGDASTGEAGTETASADQTVDATAGLAGIWTLEVAENAGDLQGEPTVSFAGFRVDEVLAGGIGDFTAVGRTADVAGSIELSGNVLVAATVEVTMGTLRTDNSSRDSQVRRALGTNDFPQAIFTLVEPVELPANMADGETFSGSAHGDLTIKGITDRVTFDLQAQLVDDTIVAVGSSDVIFSDFGVTVPSAPIVVSVEDHGIMEFQLLFTR